MRYELLDGEIFDNLKEAQIIIERWKRLYNTIRPHQTLGNKAPVPETVAPDWGEACHVNIVLLLV